MDIDCCCLRRAVKDGVRGFERGSDVKFEVGCIWGASASPEKKRRRSESENLCSGNSRVTERTKGSSARVFNDAKGTVAANELGAMK